MAFLSVFKLFNKKRHVKVICDEGREKEKHVACLEVGVSGLKKAGRLPPKSSPVHMMNLS